MPFCPKCKTEYREGFTVCADCKIPLVKSLEKTELDEVSEDSYSIERQYGEIDMSDVFSTSEEEYNAETVIPEIEFVPDKNAELDSMSEKDKEVQRMKAAQARMKEVKADRAASEYISKQDKASELFSSGMMLVIIGALGVIFIVLLMLGVFPFKPRGIVSYAIDGILAAFFALFIYFGINSFVRYYEVKKESANEDTENNEFEEWYVKTFTKEFVDSDLNLTEDSTANFFMRNAKIKYIVHQNYPDLREDYVDMVIDKYYGDVFE